MLLLFTDCCLIVLRLLDLIMKMSVGRLALLVAILFLYAYVQFNSVPNESYILLHMLMCSMTTLLIGYINNNQLITTTTDVTIKPMRNKHLVLLMVFVVWWPHCYTV